MPKRSTTLSRAFKRSTQLGKALCASCFIHAGPGNRVSPCLAFDPSKIKTEARSARTAWTYKWPRVSSVRSVSPARDDSWSLANLYDFPPLYVNSAIIGPDTLEISISFQIFDDLERTARVEKPTLTSSAFANIHHFFLSFSLARSSILTKRSPMQIIFFKFLRNWLFLDVNLYIYVNSFLQRLSNCHERAFFFFPKKREHEEFEISF